mmetsp:Transcript_40260/g.74482  ORF Transcript_40260/g.74482 Transcript_40260/m.74482 type:complete len:110 (+) Transcript_40260:45-374(+)
MYLSHCQICLYHTKRRSLCNAVESVIVDFVLFGFPAEELNCKQRKEVMIWNTFIEPKDPNVVLLTLGMRLISLQILRNVISCLEFELANERQSTQLSIGRSSLTSTWPC